MANTNGLCAIILAAGEGKRMNSSKPKVLLEVLCKPMLGWVLDAAASAGITDVCVVTGCKEEMVRAYLGDSAETVTQTERKGTGHAVMMAKDFLERHRGQKVLVACGDAPFLSGEAIASALEQHIENTNACTVISAELENPFGYGRIIRDRYGAVRSIVEQKEGTPEQLAVNEVNSGTYWFNTDDLLTVLDPEYIKPSGKTGEIYLTDTLAALRSLGLSVGACVADDSNIILGANNPAQLDHLNELARNQAIDRVLANGARVLCRESVLIGGDVEIAPDTTILPGCVIIGKTTIGSNCKIGPNASIKSCSIGSGSAIGSAELKYCSVAENARIPSFKAFRSVDIDCEGNVRTRS